MQIFATKLHLSASNNIKRGDYEYENEFFHGRDSS